MKNGAMTSTSMRFFQRPALKAIAYASGYPSKRHRIVAMPAYTNDRTSSSQ